MEEKIKMLDLSFLREFCEGDNKKMVQYIHTFLETAPEELHTMQSASNNEQWVEVKSIAHQLKPQIIFIGLPVVQDLIERIEQGATENNKEKIIPLLMVELEQAMEDATDSLIQTLVTLS